MASWSDEKHAFVCSGCGLVVDSQFEHYGPYGCIAALISEIERLNSQLSAAQPAIEAWAQHEADNERQEKLQEEMIAEGLIKRPYWQ